MKIYAYSFKLNTGKTYTVKPCTSIKAAIQSLKNSGYVFPNSAIKSVKRSIIN